MPASLECSFGLYKDHALGNTHSHSSQLDLRRFVCEKAHFIPSLQYTHGSDVSSSGGCSIHLRSSGAKLPLPSLVQP